jgi:hypothetical protein
MQYAPPVLSWLDERDRIKAIMAELPGVRGTQSPKGKDANDWLQAGKLEALIVGMLEHTDWVPPVERDLSSYVGEVVSGELWQRLQGAACDGWQFVGRQVDTDWPVERYEAVGYVD